MTPYEWQKEDPAFNVKEWVNLDFDSIEAAEMSRHFLILGETGSGKTKSAIIPIMNSIANYQVNGKRPSALVIDPKNELYERIKHLPFVIDFVTSVTKNGKTINFFEGVSTNLSSDTIKTSILQLFPKAVDPKDIFWRIQQDLCIRSFIDIDNAIFQKDGIAEVKKFWNHFIVDCNNRLNSFEEDAISGVYGKEGTGVYKTALQTAVICAGYSSNNYFLRFNFLINDPFALELFLVFWAQKESDVLERESYRVLQQLVNWSKKSHGQFSGVVGFVSNVFSNLCDHEILANVNFNPYEEPYNCLSIKAFMDSGNWLVYSPSGNSDVGDLIARIIKTKFFEFTFSRDEKERPFAYICDEFQRFITSDKRGGEQSYLDRCRAFRAICVLASQSLASLAYTLKTNGEGQDLSDSSLKIILNNTGNKFFFRNTDIDTISTLQGLIPLPYKERRPHVIGVRPTSTLAPGECYYLLSNGNWGRAKVDISEQ